MGRVFVRVGISFPTATAKQNIGSGKQGKVQHQTKSEKSKKTAPPSINNQVIPLQVTEDNTIIAVN